MSVPLELARARLILDQPYFASAAMALANVPCPAGSLGAVAVDARWRVTWDPPAAWTVAECAAVLAHEIQHLLREHHARAEALGADGYRWNLAADAEVNDDVAGLPPEVVRARHLGQPDGLLAEQYYAAMQEQQQRAGAASGDPVADARAGAASGDRGQCARPGGDPVADARAGAASGDCGQCARPGGDPAADARADAAGERGLAPVESRTVREQTARDIMAGTAPAGLRRWAQTILAAPRIDWRRLLRGAVSRALAREGDPRRTSYPARRPSTGCAMLPRWRAERPAAAMVVDTSGSITDSDLSSALAIARSAARHADLTVWACDTSATRVRRIAPDALVGGGGTDMGAGIAAALSVRPAPRVVVVVTDAQTPWPSAPPAARVVVVCPPAAPPTPDWCVRVEVQP